MIGHTVHINVMTVIIFGYLTHLKTNNKNLYEMTRLDILTSKGYWEENERTPEEITDRINEAVNLVFEKAKTVIVQAVNCDFDPEDIDSQWATYDFLIKELEQIKTKQ